MYAHSSTFACAAWLKECVVSPMAPIVDLITESNLARRGITPASLMWQTGWQTKNVLHSELLIVF